MSHRTQITLTEEQYSRLLTLSGKTGLSLSELVRRALDRTYSGSGVQALADGFGAWGGRPLDGEAYVERLRQGLAARLEPADGRAR
jgi:Ribbon-helix-helix domain